MTPLPPDPISPSPGPPLTLSIVIPAYNEASRGLDQRLGRVQAYVAGLQVSCEILVVDDGSSDGTPALVQSLCSRGSVMRLLALTPNQGKGAAVKAGLIHSAGAYVLFMDADLATPLEEIPRFLQQLRAGADLTIASRGMPGSILERRESLVRESSGKLYNRLVQAMVIRGIMDTQCGFKAFRGPVARALAPALGEPRFGFDVELLYLARAAGFSILELPVRWTHQPYSRIHFLRDGFSMLQALFRIWRRKRSGRYAPVVAAIQERYRQFSGASSPGNHRPETSDHSPPQPGSPAGQEDAAP